MAVPSTSSFPPAPALAAPAPARVPVSRGERVAAAIVLAAYAVIWKPYFSHGNNPLELFGALQAEVWQILQRLWQFGGALPSQDYQNAAVALLLSLVFASLLLALLAVARSVLRYE